MKNASIRRISALLALCLSLSSIHAQVRIGIAGGINSSKMSFNGYITGSKTDISSLTEAGLFLTLPVEIGFGKNFALQPEVRYSQLGTSYRSESSAEFDGWRYEDNATGTFRYNTLEVPVLAKLRLGAGKFKIHVEAGPSVAVTLNGETSFRGAYSEYEGAPYYNALTYYEPYQGVYDFSFKSDGYEYLYEDGAGDQVQPFSRIAYNAHFGGGLEYDFGPFGLFLDARYVLGLSDLIPDARDSDVRLSAQQRTIGLELGAFVSLGGR